MYQETAKYHVGRQLATQKLTNTLQLAFTHLCKDAYALDTQQ